MRETKRSKKWLKKAIAIVGGWMLILIVLELSLRLSLSGSIYLIEENPHFRDRSGYFRLTQNYKGWWYGFHYDVNSHGFRMDGEIPKEKSKPRILALGDSITEGIGVIHGHDLWPAQLQKLIREKLQIETEVINTGIQGWDLLKLDENGALVPGEFRHFIKHEAVDLNPDIVVYCICLNDVPNGVSRSFNKNNDENKKRFKLFPESYREFLKRKALYRLPRDLYRENAFHKLDFSDIPKTKSDDPIWNEIRNEIRLLNEEVKKINATLVCLIIPYSYQLLSQNKEFLEENRMWEKCLVDQQIPCVELSTAFDQADILSNYALGDYIHPNGKGHALISKECLPLVEPLLLAKKK